ncbi:MAG: hypothetical protein LBH14_02780 [Desulfobulbaceae bacterium]|nr:hypothetical protein [Desulfobulbaceae bacterium]
MATTESPLQSPSGAPSRAAKRQEKRLAAHGKRLFERAARVSLAARRWPAARGSAPPPGGEPRGGKPTLPWGAVLFGAFLLGKQKKGASWAWLKMFFIAYALAPRQDTRDIVNL